MQNKKDQDLVFRHSPQRNLKIDYSCQNLDAAGKIICPDISLLKETFRANNRWEKKLKRYNLVL